MIFLFFVVAGGDGWGHRAGANQRARENFFSFFFRGGFWVQCLDNFDAIFLKKMLDASLLGGAQEIVLMLA